MNVINQSRPLGRNGTARHQTRPSTRPSLLGLGTANPTLRWSQEDLATEMAAIWGLRGEALERWRRIVAGSEIDQRCGVLPVRDVVGMSTAQRMAAYEAHAPALAAEAARRALERSNVPPERVTDVLVVTCTGFAAPGVDVELIRRLGLRADVRRTIIGFMGCFGAMTGLRTAAGATSADPAGVALLVCVELCSLHMRADRDVQNQVAAALFADGAAAAVVAGREARGLGEGAVIARVGPSHSRLIERGRDWMSWRITDDGFAMTLTREVPAALRRCIGQFVTSTVPPQPRTLVVHPGGPGILDAVGAGLALDGRDDLDAARAVLRRSGNMSSATVLYVLEEALRRGGELPALLMAFGPGLSVEGQVLLPPAPQGATSRSRQDRAGFR